LIRPAPVEPGSAAPPLPQEDPMEEHIRSWLVLVVSLGSLLFTIAAQRGRARREELEKVAARIDQLEDQVRADVHAGFASRSELRERMIAIEEQLKHVPDIDAVHRMEIALGEIRSDVKVQNQVLASLALTTRRLDERFMKDAPKDHIFRD
jgi:hypothetical protein